MKKDDIVDRLRKHRLCTGTRSDGRVPAQKRTTEDGDDG